MTQSAKEKAKELIYAMYSEGLSDRQAKDCALICVEQILESGKDVDEFADSYWLEVKAEIEKS